LSLLPSATSYISLSYRYQSPYINSKFHARLAIFRHLRHETFNNTVFSNATPRIREDIHWRLTERWCFHLQRRDPPKFK
jgi:hypothetical protein